jgi:hypothetical protein
MHGQKNIKLYVITSLACNIELHVICLVHGRRKIILKRILNNYFSTVFEINLTFLMD